MSELIRAIIEDNDDGDDTHGRLDDMNVFDAAADLALKQSFLDALLGSAAVIHHEIGGHVVTADLGETGHDNEFSIFVDGVPVLRVDVNFITMRQAA